MRKFEDAEIVANVAIANTYRMEGLKQTLTISAALLAFTVAFLPAHVSALTGPWRVSVAIIGALTCIALASSVFIGIFQIRCWGAFYMSYRNENNPNHEGEGHKERRSALKSIGRTNRWQRVAFVMGVGATALVAVTGFVVPLIHQP